MSGQANKASRAHYKFWFGLTIVIVIGYFIGLLTWATQGFQFFTYTLDDPYIHLKLAKNIGLGHYGFNLSEASAPSSSIIWPFILVPFSTTHFFEYIPLALNLLLSLVLASILFITVAELGYKFKNASFLTLAFILLLNIFGLAINGLEHVLQILMVIAIFREFLLALRGEERLWRLSALLAFGVCIRYEMLVFWAAAVGFYFFKKDLKRATIIFIVPLVPVVIFSFFLQSLNLGYLPSSVKAKTVSDSNVILSFLNTFSLNATSRQGLGILVLTSLNIFLSKKAGRLNLSLLALLIIPSFLHLVVGKFGWFFRYEIYIYAYLILFFVSLFSYVRLKTAQSAVCIGFIGWFCAPYVLSIGKLHQAIRNIYYQQGITAQFVRKHLNEPVGLNDIGLVGFKHEYEVLDLWGLASHKALQLRLHSKDFSWITALAQEHGVKTLFVYEKWIQPPSEWRKIAEFVLLEKNVVLGEKIVAVYILSDNADNILKSLNDFKNEIAKAPVEIRFY